MSILVMWWSKMAVNTSVLQAIELAKYNIQLVLMFTVSLFAYAFFLFLSFLVSNLRLSQFNIIKITYIKYGQILSLRPICTWAHIVSQLRESKRDTGRENVRKQYSCSFLQLFTIRQGPCWCFFLVSRFFNFTHSIHCNNAIKKWQVSVKKNCIRLW